VLNAGLEIAAGGLLGNELSRIISQATAPAFLLGAMAGLISVLVGRLNRIVDRGNALIAIADDDPVRGGLKAEIPLLKRRAKLISKAIEFAVTSGVFTTCLVLVAFGSAFLGARHEYGAAILFMLAMGSFGVALVYLWAEVRISLRELEVFP